MCTPFYGEAAERHARRQAQFDKRSFLAGLKDSWANSLLNLPKERSERSSLVGISILTRG